MNKFKKIFSLALNYKKNLYGSLFFSLINAVLSVFTFAAMMPLLSILFDKTNKTPIEPILIGSSKEYYFSLLQYKMDVYTIANGPLKTLFWICLFIVVMALLKNVIYYLSLRNIAVIRTGIARDLRKKLYHRIVKLPLSYFSNERKGDLMSRMTNDVMEIEFSIIGAIEMLFKAPTLIVIYLFSLFFISWKLTIFALIFLPISGFLISSISKTLKNAAKRGKDKLGELMVTSEETLGGMRIIKAFHAENSFKKKFDKLNEEYFSLMNGLYKREYLASPTSEFISFVIISILLFIGGYFIFEDNTWMTGEAFIVYLVIFSQIIPPAKQLSDGVFKLKKGEASIDRINEILTAEVTIKDSENAKDVNEIGLGIEFNDVRFKYQEKEVLKGINFRINEGETIALVGPSGGGKSTIANLLARFYDTSSGSISVNGTSIKEITLESLRGMMGVVTQDSILFNDSVKNNIMLGTVNESMDNVRKAAQISNAEEFILNLEGTYDFIVGDGGNKLSGGQKQRLSIARALYKNPPILILDEATSALDTKSEKLVQEAIDNLMENRTALVIAHRLSTIQNADRILVIEDGLIAESGTHSQLIDLNGTYKSLVEMQEFA